MKTSIFFLIVGAILLVGGIFDLFSASLGARVVMGMVGFIVGGPALILVTSSSPDDSAEESSCFSTVVSLYSRPFFERFGS